jgi:7,8-dihydroneopterin aldolase/epimerase/oxygenase
VVVWPHWMQSDIYQQKDWYKKKSCQLAGLFYFRLSMTGVHLKDLQFHAHHGVYDEEEKTGGLFEVQLSVWYKPTGPIIQLEQTINYVALFEIVKQHMEKRSSLLETKAEDICEHIYKAFPFIHTIEISIFKCSPPIENFQGKTGITMQKTY